MGWILQRNKQLSCVSFVVCWGHILHLYKELIFNLGKYLNSITSYTHMYFKQRGWVSCFRDQWHDQEEWSGRTLFVKGDLAAHRVMLASIYVPNHAQLSCPDEILNILQGFMEGGQIIGADLNIDLDPPDSRSSTHLSYSYLRWVKSMLQFVRLVDVWRVHHPSDRDYTFFSFPHGSYSRIDYVLIS